MLLSDSSEIRCRLLHVSVHLSLSKSRSTEGIKLCAFRAIPIFVQHLFVLSLAGSAVEANGTDKSSEMCRTQENALHRLRPATHCCLVSKPTPEVIIHGDDDHNLSTGRRKYLKTHLATSLPWWRAAVSAKRKWIPWYTRTSTTSWAASEKRV
jgi:hypothetical protein